MTTGPARSLGPLIAAAGQGKRLGAWPEGDVSVDAIAVDSRRVARGTLFVALAGTRLDGADFVPFALRQDASAVVLAPDAIDRAEAAVGRPVADWAVPVLAVERPRRWLARAAAAFFGAQPAVVAAVTGTNGKTSVATFLRRIWETAGLPAANIGTTGIGGAGFEAEGSLTTPEPLALHAILARLAEAGCTHAAMEASSHGLAQDRVSGVRLAAAALTNITRDHLDYHASHADYVAAKLRLFREVLAEGGTAVLNADDPAFPEAEAAARARGCPVIATGRSTRADLRLLDQAFEPDGQRLTLAWAGETHRLHVPLVGAFQAENVATAAGLALATGMAPGAVFPALERLETVRGRMELAGRRANGAPVYVDYAHTPGALVAALASIRPHVAGRLIAVFGAGGDRDPGKRASMGEAAATGADVAILTDDNPRSEDPAAIRRAVAAGAPEAIEIGDRAEAILAGVDMLAAPGDLLLIAGKGHEQGQEIAGVLHPFDDAEQARAAIAVLDEGEAS